MNSSFIASGPDCRSYLFDVPKYYNISDFSKNGLGPVLALTPSICNLYILCDIRSAIFLCFFKNADWYKNEVKQIS